MPCWHKTKIKVNKKGECQRDSTLAKRPRTRLQDHDLLPAPRRNLRTQNIPDRHSQDRKRLP